MLHLGVIVERCRERGPQCSRAQYVDEAFTVREMVKSLGDGLRVRARIKLRRCPLGERSVLPGSKPAKRVIACGWRLQELSSTW